MSKTKETKIPRPRNAWIIFLSEFCQQMGRGNLHGQRASQAAAKVWDKMPDAQKASYEEKAKVELQEHQMKYPGYVYTPARAGSGSGSSKKTGTRTSKMEAIKDDDISKFGLSRASFMLSESDSTVYLSPSPEFVSPARPQSPNGAFQSPSFAYMSTFTPLAFSYDFTQEENSTEDVSMSLPLTPILPTSPYSPSVPAYDLNATQLLFPTTESNDNVGYWIEHPQYPEHQTVPEYYLTQEPTYPALQLDENHPLSHMYATRFPTPNEYWVTDPQYYEDQPDPECYVAEEPVYPTLQLDEDHLLSQYVNNHDQEFYGQTPKLDDSSYIAFPSLDEFTFDLSLNSLDIPPFPDADVPFELNAGVPFEIPEWVLNLEPYVYA